ncbi:MAG: ATP-dependent RNA helicase RhlE [Verrucomicrobia subdivision 3 bacterium]|nr:ATP-dependent RNA helicase RhlE [Limisphaerales bacterium]MCS1415545.1 ATP-dependent RNA helicase RhlE [Limisphaerales bacterium]
MELFKELDLADNLQRAVEACGFEKPTPIQRESIPAILAGKDILASAQTGTGKTASFVLPAMQKMLLVPRHGGNGPRVLILTPTRELAAQVNAHIRDLGQFCKFTNGSVIGGMAYPPQIRLLQKKLDILVATPGRLMDHMEKGRVNYSSLDIFVLDEADRMLDLGFIGDIRNIASKLPKKRQTLLFSATLEGKVLTIAHDLLKDPVTIQLTSNTVKHELIRQKVYHADNLIHKHRLLDSCLKRDELTQALVFTATKRTADRLASMLSAQGHDSAPLHGDLSQGARKKTMNRMKQGKLRILVATDVAARGLDIKGISHVINFDLPNVAEDYIHRIGRTGRAGENGTAISLVSPEDWGKLREIERLTGMLVERSVVLGLEPEKASPEFQPQKARSSAFPRFGRRKRRFGSRLRR